MVAAVDSRGHHGNTPFWRPLFAIGERNNESRGGGPDMMRQLWRLFFPRPTSRLDPRAVTVAVQWWLDSLQGFPARDVGEESALVMGYVLLAASNVAAATEGQLLRFAELLEDEIHRQYAQAGRVHFRVDYDPKDGLGRIARKCGINPHRFPSKTTFVIHGDGAVEVAPGYHASWKRLWPAAGTEL